MDYFFALCAMQVSQHAAQELRGKPPWSPLYPRSYARIIHGLGFGRGPEKAPHQVVCHGLEGATQVEAAFTCVFSKFSPWIRAWIYIILFYWVKSALYGDPDVIFISKTAPDSAAWRPWHFAFQSPLTFRCLPALLVHFCRFSCSLSITICFSFDVLNYLWRFGVF